MTPVSQDKSLPIPEKWWFNLKTGESEFGRFVDSANRVGPFETKSEADNALTILRERSESWACEEESGD